MSISHARPGEVVPLQLGPVLHNSKATTLVKTAELELIRLVLPAGKKIPSHKAKGEITIQCLQGRIDFTVGDKTQVLEPGHLFYLTAGEQHAVLAIEDSSLLITILLGGDE